MSGDPPTLYAAGGGFKKNMAVFKSTDGGLWWAPTPDRAPELSVYGIIIDPEHPTTCYVRAHNGLRKSINEGEDWTPTGLSLHVNALVIAPHPASTLYAATEEGLFTSTKGGQDWERGGLSQTYVRGLTIDPHNAAILYANHGGFFVKSVDGGKSWNRMGVSQQEIVYLVIDSHNPATLYGATQKSGILKEHRRRCGVGSR